MTALDRAISNPRSLAARYALLSEWEAANDPRAELLDYQLRERKGRWELWSPISDLIRNHGREWAGRVAELVNYYTFHLGLVGQVTLPGEKFLEIGAELFELAPIQHVNLTRPFGSIESIANSPLIMRLTSLSICGGKAEFGDVGARVIATASAVSHLKYLALNTNEITRAGVEELTESKYLRKTQYLGLEGNPADPTPFDDFWRKGSDSPMYTWRLPDLAIELQQKYGYRPWLQLPVDVQKWPDCQEWALDYDYMERGLVPLENRAADLDKRVTAAGDNEETIKELNQLRAKLLSDLRAKELLTGWHETGLEVRECPTLSTYHDAVVKLESYLSSECREKWFPGQKPPQPHESNISLDWFRTPSGYLPNDIHAHGEKVSPYDWLALCERNFIDPMPNGTGERFVRLQGKIHILHYRREDGPTPRLWRALPESPEPEEGLSKGQQFAKWALEEMNKPKSKEREEYEAKKEREDQIGYLQLYLKTGQITPEEIVRQAVDKLIAEIEKLGPLEKFDKIEVPLLIANRAAALRYTPSTSLKRLHLRYIELAVWEGSCLSTYLDTGAHAEMLQFLRRPTIVAEVLKTGDEAIISLERDASIHQSEYGWRED